MCGEVMWWHGDYINDGEMYGARVFNSGWLGLDLKSDIALILLITLK